MHVVRVDLGPRSYAIRIGRGLLNTVGSACAALQAPPRCALITDTNVASLYGTRAQRSLVAAGFEPCCVVIPAGEKAKRLQRVSACYEALAAHRIERRSLIVAIGGGVVGDLAGFVAATYLRGLPWVQIPTTLLAQVDSSVGGKVGVNLPDGKNLVGAFHQPKLVLCDLDTLETLSPREFRAGLAEIIKYGVIADARLFRRLEHHMDRIVARDPDLLGPIIARSCQIKARVVGADETEEGLRAVLNFGHTIGHGLEAISRYGRYLHGEAIAVGQVAAAHLSHQCAGLPNRQVDQIQRLLRRAGLPVTVRLNRPQRERLFTAMRLDKKVRGGDIRFVLARRLGSARYGETVPPAAIEQVLNSLHPRPRHGRQ